MFRGISRAKYGIHDEEDTPQKFLLSNSYGPRRDERSLTASVTSDSFTALMRCVISACLSVIANHGEMKLVFGVPPSTQSERRTRIPSERGFVVIPRTTYSLP